LGVVPRALVAMCGFLQTSDPARSRGRPLSRFIRDRIEAASEAYLGDDTTASPERAFADPIVILEQGRPGRPFPPTFASVGTRDPIMDDTVRLGDRLRALDVAVETQTHHGEPHAFQALVFRSRVKKHWNDLHAFVGRAIE
jgi:acetyl esterase/lipase